MLKEKLFNMVNVLVVCIIGVMIFEGVFALRMAANNDSVESISACESVEDFADIAVKFIGKDFEFTGYTPMESKTTMLSEVSKWEGNHDVMVIKEDDGLHMDVYANTVENEASAYVWVDDDDYCYELHFKK